MLALQISSFASELWEDKPTKALYPMNQCNHHEKERIHCICSHLDLKKFDYYYLRFSGQGAEYAVVCTQCQSTPWEELNRVCEQCFREASRGTFNQCGIVGNAEVIVATQERCELELMGTIEFAHPILAGAKWRNRWLVLLEDRSFHSVDPYGNESERMGQVSDPCQLDWLEQLDLITSSDGRYAAITNRKGQHGLVWDLNWDRIVMHLNRGDYHLEQTPFPVCFFDRGDDTRVIAATEWNRLDIFDPSTGVSLTPRDTKRETGAPEPAHHLDYFVGELALSPNEQTLLVDGWVWHPLGVVGTVDLAAWRTGSTFACEDGLSAEGVRSCNYNWNVGKAFLSDSEVILWGIGNDDEYMVDGAVLYDLQRGLPIRYIAGPPNARFVVDEWLFCFSPNHDTTAWNVVTSERVWHAPGHHAAVYNSNSKHFLGWTKKTLRASRWIQKEPNS